MYQSIKLNKTEVVVTEIFERFYRGDESYSRGKAGSGLGLLIVESIMKVHGGKATAQSDGTSGVTITLGF